MPSPPETYYITSPTPHVPNSPLPVLVYRSALPGDPDAETTRSHIEPNDWLPGGVFKTYTAHHFHSVTHTPSHTNVMPCLGALASCCWVGARSMMRAEQR